MENLKISWRKSKEYKPCRIRCKSLTVCIFFFSGLEIESPVINWSDEITEQLGSRIYPLWNRSAGDCLLDSILQASYGVFDRDNTLRRALYDSLTEGGSR